MLDFAVCVCVHLFAFISLSIGKVEIHIQSNAIQSTKMFIIT